MSRTMVAGAFAVAALMLLAAISQPARPAFAAFHCMRIHAVMHGYNGDEDAQFVELRLNAAGQSFVGGHKLRFLDANGLQKAEFTFPGNIANAATGDSILIASREFNDLYTPGGNADFEFNGQNTSGLDPLSPVQGPGGKVIFAPGQGNCFGQVPVDSVAYGSGTVTADYGSKAVALPSPTTDQGLRLSNLNTTVTNNSTEYSLQSAATTTVSVLPANLASDFSFPRNNARQRLGMVAPSGVGGTVTEPELAAPETLSVEKSDDGSLVIPIVAVAAAVILASTGLGALELRRRSRRV